MTRARKTPEVLFAERRVDLICECGRQMVRYDQFGEPPYLSCGSYKCRHGTRKYEVPRIGIVLLERT